nr:hypothetical protein [Tanacetum cinerariifolium]
MSRHLELDKLAQAIEITKLKRRVKKLEMRKKVKVLKLRRLSEDMDANADVVLEEAKKEDETKPAEVQKVVDVVTNAKIITEVVNATSETITAASITITVAKAQVPTATLTAAPTRDKGKGILVKEPKPLKKHARIKQDKKYARELEAELNKIIDWDESINHVKKKAKEDPAMKRYQVLKRNPQTEAQARKNMMVYLKNVAGFKMDYFKGMSYDDIRLIFEAKFNTNMAFLHKIKEQIEEEESRALKRLNETPVKKAAKRKKLDEEVEKLKRHLQIMPNEDDDVYTEATPLARKVPVVNYEIIKQNNKPYYKIIRANERRYPLIKFTLDQMLIAVRLKVKEESEVSLELLRHVSKKDANYFITFTDYYSRYGYVYLLKHKHEVFETFTGYEAHVKRHTPDKLQQRSVKCIFIGYPKKTMGYYFYYPPENKIVVERYADFLEKDFILQKESGRIVKLEDEYILPSENTSERPIEEEKIDPDRLCFNVEVEEHSLGDLNDPANYKATLSNPEFKKWLVSINVKMQFMYDNKVQRLIVLPPNAKFVKSKWIYKKKTNMDGKETFSHVADIRAIRILIAIAAYYDYEILQIDVKIAFLNGFLEEEIYMNNLKVLLILIIPGKNHIPSLQEVTTYLGKCFSMKDLEEATFILGIKIYRDRSRRLIGLSQNAYLDKILKRYRMDNSKRGFIPMQVDLYLSKSQCATTSAKMKRMQNFHYASAVGSIMYAVRCTRIDSYELTIIAMLDLKLIEMTRNLKPAASEAVKEAVWIRKFIDELGVVPSNDYPIKINCDNSAAIIMAKELGIQKGTRHFKRKYHYVRECIEIGKIDIIKVHIDDNLANPFTKGLAGPKLT